MRRSVPIALVLALAAVALADSEGESPPDITAEVAQAELELRVERTDEAVLWTGTLPSVRLSLHNRSKLRVHHVVLPGDGSESGWREPHVFWSVEHHDGDQWRAVDLNRWGRCGNYDADWSDEVHTLEAGAHVTLADWGTPHAGQYGLARPGRTRVRAHYRFSRTGPDRTWSKGSEPTPSIDLGKLADYAKYELTSKWIEFEAVAPLRVSVARRSDLRLGETRPLSELFAIRVENVSDQTFTLDPDEVSLACATYPVAGRPSVKATPSRGAARAAIELAPGDHLPLLGPTGLTSDDPLVTAAVSGAIPLHLTIGLPGGSLRVRTDDFELSVATSPGAPDQD